MKFCRAMSVAPEVARGYHAEMGRQHLVAFIAIGAAIFASMAGGAIAISVAIFSARRAKANKPA